MDYKVYKITDINNEVKHVGLTTRSLNRRLKEHVYCGRFESINNLNIDLISTFDNKIDARKLEDTLQEQFGLITETQKRRISASSGSNKFWATKNEEERSQMLKRNSLNAWSKRDKETRSEIISKGHKNRIK